MTTTWEEVLREVCGAGPGPLQRLAIQRIAAVLSYYADQELDGADVPADVSSCLALADMTGVDSMKLERYRERSLAEAIGF
jgi:hypothetical protein